MAELNRQIARDLLDGWRSTLTQTARKYEQRATGYRLGSEGRYAAEMIAARFRRAAECLRDDGGPGPVLTAVDGGEEGAAA